MLLSVGRCVRCHVHSSPWKMWDFRRNVLSRLPEIVWRRTVADSRRLPYMEELIRSDAWNHYLQRWRPAEGAALPEAQCWKVGGSPQISPFIQRLRDKETELKELKQLAEDENEDLKALANAEIASCLEEMNNLKYQVAQLLIPKEDVDHCNLILEVTAGVGGQEAMLFTAEIFNMYQRYADYKNWSFDLLEYCRSDLGGVRHASASVAGLDAYRYLKYEGGVHRVQRVPKTEKQGRIHTSTMTVAVLPQPTEINLVINAKDLRVETKRASGAGGQHVNTTDSAVRIVHIPTGQRDLSAAKKSSNGALDKGNPVQPKNSSRDYFQKCTVAECQQERSQIKNKETAMKVLRAKLYNMKLEEEANKRQSARKIQVGTKGRSEKIRTYNFPQDRVTDHRIGMSMHNLEGFMFGDELLEEMIQTLGYFADYESLLELISNENICK